MWRVTAGAHTPCVNRTHPATGSNGCALTTTGVLTPSSTRPANERSAAARAHTPCVSRTPPTAGSNGCTLTTTVAHTPSSTRPANERSAAARAHTPSVNRTPSAVGRSGCALTTTGAHTPSRARHPALSHSPCTHPLREPHTPNGRPQQVRAHHNGCTHLSSTRRSQLRKGSRPMKPSRRVWTSASSGTATRGPYCPDERSRSSIGSMPASISAQVSSSRCSS
jgi:hypothetical protein